MGETELREVGLQPRFVEHSLRKILNNCLACRTLCWGTVFILMSFQQV